MKLFLSAIFLVISFQSFALDKPLLILNDPKGDDVGDGSLSYPYNRDYKKGDLDLVSLEITKAEDGSWFEARFENKIKHPSKTTPTAGPEPLDTILRKGFYAFNIDIYIDTDRIKNSGNTFTLPGRQAQVSSEHAWEKAIILSPRPEQIQQQASDTLVEQFTDIDKQHIINQFQQAIFFPTRIKVRNYSVSFFVPDSFLKTDDIQKSSLLAFVTPAQMRLRLEWSHGDDKVDITTLDIGVLPVVATHSSEYFFTSNRSKKASPIVDVLANDAESQTLQLADTDNVQLIGHAKSVARIQDNASSYHSFAELLGAQTQPQTATKSTPVNIPSTEQPVPSPDNSIANRLKKLELLKQQSLITEEEYQQHRIRILNEL